MGRCAYFTCKYYAILLKGLEHPMFWVSKGFWSQFPSNTEEQLYVAVQLTVHRPPNILFVRQSFNQPISLDLMNHQEQPDQHVQRRESTLLSHDHLNHSFCLIKTVKPIGHPQLKHVTIDNSISSRLSDQYWHFPWQWGKFSTLFPSTLFRSNFLSVEFSIKLLES